MNTPTNPPTPSPASPDKTPAGSIITLDEVRDAAATVGERIHRTPVLTCRTLDLMSGRELYLKCENFQKGGSFKIRGASNAIWKLPEDQARRGVVTHSSGNHAQALSIAARQRSIPAYIVMPSNAPRVKRAAAESHGSNIQTCEPTQAAREAAAAELLAETGGVLIPSYDHPHIVAGQGTIALELIEQVEHLDAIIAPVGGGGMLAGVALAAKALNPNLRIFGAEPVGADDAARSLACGERITEQQPQTIADGLKMTLGIHTWPPIREHVDAIFTVTDQQIIDAMQLIWQRVKIIVEPSASVGVAAAMSDALAEYDDVKRIAVVLSGGNVDLDRLPWIAADTAGL